MKEEFLERLERVCVARDAVVAACGGPWRKGQATRSGVTDCPACGGKGCLRYSRAGKNGHIRAKCDTADCVCWVE